MTVVRVDEIATGVREGDRRALAKALTLVEDGSPDDVRELFQGLGGEPISWIVGVTGPPGAGKSTLTNVVVADLRSRGARIAVLAVDPSSPRSGGALLGDRIWMRSHAADAGVYIRSMASRGHLGGLSLATADAARLLGVAGFDFVILETVGVGQSEVEIARIADVTLLVLTPGAGDAVQAAKAGVMEIADIFVVNKADRDGVRRLESDIRGTLRVAAPLAADAWYPRIVRTVGTEGVGVDLLVQALLEHRAHLEETDQVGERRRRQALHLVREAVLDLVSKRMDRWVRQAPDQVTSMTTRVMSHDLNPHGAARLLLDMVQDDL